MMSEWTSEGVWLYEYAHPLVSVKVIIRLRRLGLVSSNGNVGAVWNFVLG